MPTAGQTRAALFLARAVPFLAIWLAVGSVLRAADVLEAIPDTALAVVLINRPEETSDKIEQVAKLVHAPPVSPLTTIKVQTGMHEGIDEKTAVALAVLPAKDGSPLPQVAIFVPVTDYDKFLAQLQPDDAAEKIAAVRLAGNPMLICKQGSFAVLAQPSAKGALEAVQSSVKDVSSVLGPLRTWLGEVDAAVVATPAGIKFAVENGAPMLSLVRVGMNGIGQQQPAQAQLATEFFNLLEGGLKTFQSEVTHFALAVRADENLNLRLTVRARFAPSGDWAAVAKGLKPPKEGLLAGLPGGPFGVAFGGMVPSTFRELFGNQVASQLKINPLFGRLPAEQQAKLQRSTVGLFEPIESLGVVTGAPKAGEPLYANMVAQMKVDDAKKYLDDYSEMIQSLGDATKDLPAGSIGFEAKTIDVEGRPALDVITDLSKFTQPGAADIKPMFEKLFGPGDKVHVYLAAVDDKTVVLAYLNEETLKRAMASGKAIGQGLAADPAVAETAALLPSGPQWIAYANPQGLTGLAQAGMTAIPRGGPPLQIPEMRSAPPVGMTGKFAAGGFSIDIVAPATTLEALGEFAKKVRGGR